MWHVYGFISGFGYVTSQYSCRKKSDMSSVAKSMQEKGVLSNWKLVFKK